MTFVDVVSTYRAALVDLDSGVGVAVEMSPPCDCAPCLVAWWADRTAWEGELLIYDAAVAQLLPDAGHGRLDALARDGSDGARAGVEVDHPQPTLPPELGDGRLP